MLQIHASGTTASKTSGRVCGRVWCFLRMPQGGRIEFVDIDDATQRNVRALEYHRFVDETLRRVLGVN